MSNDKPIEVDHPAHYNKGSIEIIDFLEDQKLGFHLGNVVKYVCRAEFKGNKRKDLEKALWYLKRYLALMDKFEKDQKEDSDWKGEI